ncbi:MAG: hypothetical protein ABIY70_00725 [Capsulimonas sp.]|uniref:hypothetical protein n=1 Tax=Capsulimonas sp. TaxID=2494211 RepID=UPI0032632F1C
MNLTPKMNRSFVALKFCAAAALLLASVLPVQADAMSDLTARVAKLENLAAVQQNTITNQQVNIATLQNSSIAYQNAITSLINSVNYIKAHPTPGPAGPAGAAGALTPAQLAIFNLMSVSNKDLTITGNLHIVNGLGATNGHPDTPTNTGPLTVNGLGNLIIGYNLERGIEIGGSAPNTRAGSHNLILGDCQSYGGVGGIVSGYYNTVLGYSTSTLGGQYNMAQGVLSAITAGEHNTAAGLASSVSGGFLNSALADGSAIIAGRANETNGKNSSITGGAYNTTYGFSSTIGGGFYNRVLGYGSTVSGGDTNWEYGLASVISGGKGISNLAEYHWSAGGVYNSNGTGKFKF